MHFASHRNFVKPASIGKVTIVKPASIGKATFSIGLFNLMAGNSLSGDRSEDNAVTKSINLNGKSAVSPQKIVRARRTRGSYMYQIFAQPFYFMYMPCEKYALCHFFDAWHNRETCALF
jgi:hypothetical protein